VNPLPKGEGTSIETKYIFIQKEKQLNKIVKLAKCEFIYDLEKGLDTEI